MPIRYKVPLILTLSIKTPSLYVVVKHLTYVIYYLFILTKN